MKKMNRREFLTLSGAAVVALSLAACGGSGDKAENKHYTRSAHRQGS